LFEIEAKLTPNQIIEKSFFFLDWHYKHENRETRSQTLIGNLSEYESIRVVVVISNANLKIFLHGNFSLFKIKKVFDKILNNRIFELNYLQMKLKILNLFNWKDACAKCLKEKYKY
jgi:hypothetical protein